MNGAARMEMIRTLLSNRRLRWALAGCVGIAVAAAWVAWKSGVDLEFLKGLWTRCDGYLTAHPAALFWALVILPALPIPTSALLFTAGIVWGDRPVMAILLCLLAMALNQSWTYWLAARPARGIVEKLLASGSLHIPDLPRGDHLKLILILRLTPGFPFFIQNYVLGFMRAPFLLYLPVSLLCSGLIGTGVVLSGVGLGGGKLRWAILGISLIVVGGILTHFIRGWLAKRKSGRS